MSNETPDNHLREFLAKARGTAATARVLSLDELGDRHGAESAATLDVWGLSAMRGRLVELSARGASATLTTAIGLVHEAQTSGEPVAWITLTSGSFYPPDVADNGVDLAALVIVRTSEAIGAARAAERLLRCGAFGLVVIDLGGEATVEIPMAHQGRLVTLAQAHDAAVVCITDKTSDSGSLGSLVSLRAEVLRTRITGRSPITASATLTVRAIKDKRRGPGWIRTLKARGPAGM